MFILSHGVVGGFSVFRTAHTSFIIVAAAGAMFPDFFELLERVRVGFVVFADTLYSGAVVLDAVRHGATFGCQATEHHTFTNDIAHSFLVLGFVTIFVRWRNSLHGIYFVWGWLTHLVVDLFSHYAPHAYFWPTLYALPFPSVWDHERFWHSMPWGIAISYLGMEFPLTVITCVLIYFALSFCKLRVP